MYDSGEYVKYSIFGGIGSSFGSLFGKLSGTFGESLLMFIFLFVLMISFNTIGMILFAKSLNLSTSSLEPTLVNTASNYVSSAFIGILLFNEETPLVWWMGTILILFGLLVISSNKEKTE